MNVYVPDGYPGLPRNWCSRLLKSKFPSKMKW